jgi:hypothetical protein
MQLKSCSTQLKLIVSVNVYQFNVIYNKQCSQLYTSFSHFYEIHFWPGDSVCLKTIRSDEIIWNFKIMVYKNAVLSKTLGQQVTQKHCYVSELSYEGGMEFCQYFCLIQNYMASDPRRLLSSYLLLWKPQISHHLPCLYVTQTALSCLYIMSSGKDLWHLLSLLWNLCDCEAIAYLRFHHLGQFFMEPKWLLWCTHK